MELTQLSNKYITDINAGSFLHQNINSKEAKDNPEKLAGQFESYFYRLLLKEVRNTQLTKPILNSHAMEQIRDMQDEEIAGLMGSQGHLGVKKMILQHLEHLDSDTVYTPDEFKNLKEEINLKGTYRKGTLKGPWKEKNND